MLRIASFLACLLLATVAWAAAPIGAVSRVQGGAEGLSNGRTINFIAGSPVFEGHRISTGLGARLEIEFIDGTRLIIGERSQLVIDHYVFRGRSHVNRLALSISGAFRFISGRLGKAKGADVMVDTPIASVGVRGTDFVGVPIDGQYGVLLLEGSIRVTSRAGAAALRRPGTGVNIVPATGALSPVTAWPRGKVARALAQVTFR